MFDEDDSENGCGGLLEMLLQAWGFFFGSRPPRTRRVRGTTYA